MRIHFATTIASEYKYIKRNAWFFLILNIGFSVSGGILPFLVLIISKDFSFSDVGKSLLYTFLIISTIPSVLIGKKISNYMSSKKCIVIFRIVYSLSLITYIFSQRWIYIRCICLMIAFVSIVISRPILNSMALEVDKQDNVYFLNSLYYMSISISDSISPIITSFFLDNVSRLFFTYFIINILSSIIFGILIQSDIKPKNNEVGYINTREKFLNKKIVMFFWLYFYLN